MFSAFEFLYYTAFNQNRNKIVGLIDFEFVILIVIQTDTRIAINIVYIVISLIVFGDEFLSFSKLGFQHLYIWHISRHISIVLINLMEFS